MLDLNSVNCAFERFKENVNERRYGYIKQAVSELDCAVLSQKVWQRFFSVGASKNSLRLIFEGSDKHPSFFLKSRIGDGLIEHVTVSDHIVQTILKKGGTLVLNHGQEFIPELKVIQEHLEAMIGCRCWIQCYVTNSQNTAFKMHQDDHSFFILQLQGSKKWVHDASEVEECDNLKENVTYSTGDLAFYPKGQLHDVHGTGELSLHLTIAFEGFDDLFYDVLSNDQKRRVIWLREGTSLPFSVSPALVSDTTPVRFAYSVIPPFVMDEDQSFMEVAKGKVNLSQNTLNVLEWAKNKHCFTAKHIAEDLSFEIEQAVQIVRNGLVGGLFINGLD